jgi:hypothetical protein
MLLLVMSGKVGTHEITLKTIKKKLFGKRY